MSSQQPPRREHASWCSLRLRFDARELELLHASEQVRGTALSIHGRPEALRNALTLAKAGHKISHAHPGSSVSLDEVELELLLEAVRFATAEVHWATSAGTHVEAADERRRQVILDAFPELVERGLWRSFGLTRDLEALAERMHGALNS